MKQPLIVIAIAASLLMLPGAAQSQARPRPRDAWLGPDKVKHFFIAGFIESVAFAGAETVGAKRSSALPVGVSIAAIFSIGREVHDGKVKGLFSVRDLAFDALGATAAFLLLKHTQR